MEDPSRPGATMSWKRPRVVTSLYLLVVLPLFLSIVADVFAVATARRGSATLADLVRENLAVRNQIQTIEEIFLDRLDLLLGALRGEPESARAAAAPAEKRIDAALRELDRSLSDIGLQSLASGFGRAARDRLSAERDVVRLVQHGEVNRARAALLGDDERRFHDFERALHDVATTVSAWSREQSAAARRDMRTAMLVIWVQLALTAVFAAWVLYYLSRKVHRRLKAMIGVKPGASTDLLDAIDRYLHSLEQDVVESRSELDRSRRAAADSAHLASLGQLAAGVAHEIRNPLTSIRLRLFSLRQAELPSSLDEDLAVIAGEVDRLDAVVCEFLDFSRPAPLQLKRETPASLVRRSLNLMQPVIAHRNVAVICEVSDALPPVLADGDRIAQVLINLIGNALDSMESGGTIRITARRTTPEEHDEAESVAIHVTDNGRGISEAHRGRIFEPFFSTKAAGTGLGLSIARHIMSRHGGRLSLVSTSASGTEFVVRIPTAEEACDGPDTGGRRRQEHPRLVRQAAALGGLLALDGPER